jgi:uncharacterized protein
VKRELAAFASGAIFSAGLCLSGMTRPNKILSFLDFFGHWDPSLAFVMVGAIAVSAWAFRVSARGGQRPLFGGRFHVPSANERIAPRLVAGSALFGVGWGLSGLCPGPAVTSLATGELGPLVFVASMLGGMALYRAVPSLQRGRAYSPGR